MATAHQCQIGAYSKISSLTYCSDNVSGNVLTIEISRMDFFPSPPVPSVTSDSERSMSWENCGQTSKTFVTEVMRGGR